MYEVIHLSLSSVSNHLNSHFYNSQESYFVYSDSEVENSNVNPNIRFQQGVGYTPRALIWDLKGGFGALKKYSGAYSDEISVPLWNDQSKPHSIIQKPIASSEYQKSLDYGLPEPKLSTKNTLYWSDYLRISYHPKSQLSLNDWEYDPIEYPNGRLKGSNRPFKGHDIGVGQWDEMQAENDKEYLDRSFRPIIEQCDSLSGLTISTDVDSSWGGFTESMLAEIVDEYAPKIPKFVWGIYDQPFNKTKKLSVADNLSRIKSTSGLLEYSTLFIPLSLPKVNLLPSQIQEFLGESPTPWQITALYNLIYEPISVLSSLRGEKRVSMTTLSDSLISGDEKRNMVIANSATSSFPLIDFSSALIHPSSKPTHYFSKYALTRQPTIPPPSSIPPPNFGIIDLKSGQSPWDFINNPTATSSSKSTTSTSLLDKYFDEAHLLEHGTSASNLYKNNLENFPYALPTSYPTSIISSEDTLYSSLSVTTAPSATLKSMADYVSRFDRGTDDREQLKDSLSTFAQSYSWGYDSDSELSDD